MEQLNKLCIFLFTRDLRLYDNIGLIRALKESKLVLPCFIFNPTQLYKNPYKSNNCVQFMCESLEKLNSSLNKRSANLFFYEGKVTKILEKIVKKYGCDSIYINKDYTKFAQDREYKISKLCKKLNIEFKSFEDHSLLNNVQIQNEAGSYYKKFTPFYEKAKKVKITKIEKNLHTNFFKERNSTRNSTKNSTKNFNLKKFYIENKNIAERGGRQNAIKILSNLTKYKKYKKYKVQRDFPHLDCTTHLSAHLKFGTISPREAYFAFKKAKIYALIKQLFWRDFYIQIMLNNPNVLFVAMKENYRKIKWTNNLHLFNAWKNGQTGFPLVDAGMRQLNETGYMHNRCRMLVSNFLVKILHCDWKMGEKYFAQHLVDYDPSLNNGNWQWSASTGADSQPYFRVFNPWRQAEKYDRECKYIKQWIKEVKDIPSKDLLNWGTAHLNYPNCDYPKPIVQDLQKNFKKTIVMYSTLSN